MDDAFWKCCTSTGKEKITLLLPLLFREKEIEWRKNKEIKYMVQTLHYHIAAIVYCADPAVSLGTPSTAKMRPWSNRLMPDNRC